MRLQAGYIPQYQQSTACMSLVDYPSLLGNIDWGCKCRYLSMPEEHYFPLRFQSLYYQLPILS